MKKTMMQELFDNKCKLSLSSYGGSINCIKLNNAEWDGVVCTKYGLVDVSQFLYSDKNVFMITLRMMIDGKVVDTHIERKYPYSDTYLATIATKWSKLLFNQII